MTIVVNTLTGAVTEYTGWAFQSITPEIAGNATGLYSLGGDTDLEDPIVSTVITGKKQWGTSIRKFIDLVFFSLKGSGTSELIVAGESASWTYEFPVLADGVSRAKPGRGIFENYLAFGYSNADGEDFELDRIEVNITPSPKRRT